MYWENKNHELYYPSSIEMQNEILQDTSRELLQNVLPRRVFYATRGFKLEYDPFLHAHMYVHMYTWRAGLRSLWIRQRDTMRCDAMPVQLARSGFYRAANNHFHLAFPQR